MPETFNSKNYREVKPTTCGIYAIVGPTGRRYVGQGSVRKRWIEHVRRLNKNDHHAPFLQRAWNKYGVDAFAFEVLVECAPEGMTISEQFWMDYYRERGGLYNSAPAAGTVRGYKFTEEQRTRQKIITAQTFLNGRVVHNKGVSHSPEQRAKLSEARRKHSGPNKGKIFSLEYRAKLSVARRKHSGPNKGKTHSPELRAKMSAGRKGKGMGHGRKLSQEARAKISQSLKRYFTSKSG